MRRIRLIAFALLVLLLGVPVVLTWRTVRQERLDRALIGSIKRNDAQATVNVLKQGADPNATDTPPQSRSLWRRLLNQIQGKPMRTNRGLPALILAFYKLAEQGWTGKTDIVKALLDHNVDVNFIDRWGHTPLVMAVMTKNADLVKAVLADGANVNGHGKSGETALMEAAASEDAEIVQILLAHHAQVNLKQKYGFTALKLVEISYSMGRHAEVIKLLTQAGAKE